MRFHSPAVVPSTATATEEHLYKEYLYITRSASASSVMFQHFV